MYTKLYIYVEGNDEENFFNNIIGPDISNYDKIEIRKHRNIRKEMVKQLIAKHRSQTNEFVSDYIFLYDQGSSRCVIEKKDNIMGVYNFLERNKTIIVGKEIEGWYLAGINKENCRKLGIKYMESTDHINKEAFSNMKPRKFDSLIDFKRELLKLYDIQLAMKRNNSFKFFLKRLHDLYSVNLIDLI